MNGQSASGRIKWWHNCRIWGIKAPIYYIKNYAQNYAQNVNYTRWFLSLEATALAGTSQRHIDDISWASDVYE